MEDTSISHYKSHRMVRPTFTPVLTKCCHRECVLEDRISALPDDILISIISHLKLREAARTSVLSHRWRFMWTLTNGVLDFVEFVPICDAVFTHEGEILLKTAGNRFVEWVNLVLCLHKAPTIDEFKVCLNFEIGSSDVVDSWIKFALEKHAKRLILDLGHYGYFNTHPKYALRAQLFSNRNLSSLTTLHLKRTVVTGEVLGYMLSCFPLLQVLHLHGLLSLLELKIAGPSPSLRCLVIKNCCFMRYLEVHAVNLKSFGYYGPKILKYFKEVPCLVEADVDEVFLIKNICQFSSCFSLLESLSLRLPPQRLKWMHEYFPKLPKFNKLRWLKLNTTVGNVNCCLSHCTKLLKASPSLQRFVLEINVFGKINSDIKIQRRKTIYQHKQLKVIEFIGFRGCAKYAKLVQRLLAKLPSLEKVVVDPQPVLPVHKGYGEWDLEKTIATAQLLHKSFSPAAKLVISRSRPVDSSQGVGFGLDFGPDSCFSQ